MMVRIVILLSLCAITNAFVTFQSRQIPSQLKKGVVARTCVSDKEEAGADDASRNRRRTTVIVPNDDNNQSRRNILFRTIGIGATVTASTSFCTTFPSVAVDDDLTRGGVPLTPFNGLAFQYRGGSEDVSKGLDGSTLTEPSIPYNEFLARLDKGEVEFVEFLAPNGDAAYVTFKSSSSSSVVDESGNIVKKENPIRIGDGYPVEDPEGWSSPAFVIKIVKKKNVPYKFTLPALAKYNN